MELGPAAKDVCSQGFTEEPDSEDLPSHDDNGGNSNISGTIPATTELPGMQKTALATSKLNCTGRTKEEKVRVQSYLRRGVDRFC